MVNYELFISHPVGEISVEKESSIQAFSEKYAVDQDLVVKYMHHLAYLEMMKQKRERERREKAEREQRSAKKAKSPGPQPVYWTAQSDSRKEIV